MTPNGNGNGKIAWQVAFWVMGVIFLGGLTCLTQAVVANDRMRASEDLRIEAEARCDRDIFKKETNEKYSLILVKLASIEEQLKYLNK